MVVYTFFPKLKKTKGMAWLILWLDDGPDDQGKGIRFLAKTRKFYLLHTSTEWLWHSPSLLFKRYWRIVPRG